MTTISMSFRVICNMTSFWPLTRLWAALTSKRRLGHSNWLYFLNPDGVRIPLVAALKNFPVRNFWVRSVLPRIFSQISVRTHKKMWRARVRSILVPPTFHIAILKRYTPKFSGVNSFASRSFQSQVTQIRAHQKSWFWGVFFAQNKFSWPNGQLLPIAYHTYFESYWSDG